MLLSTNQDCTPGPKCTLIGCLKLLEAKLGKRNCPTKIHKTGRTFQSCYEGRSEKSGTVKSRLPAQVEHDNGTTTTTTTPKVPTTA